jgi:hypothetical protein
VTGYNGHVLMLRPDVTLECPTATIYIQSVPCGLNSQDSTLITDTVSCMYFVQLQTVMLRYQVPVAVRMLIALLRYWCANFVVAAT